MLKGQVPTWLGCPSPLIGCVPSCFGSVRVRCGDLDTLRCVYSTVLYCTVPLGTVLSTTRAAAVEAMVLVDRYLIPASDEPIHVQDPGLGGQVHGTRYVTV
jgi:hypothetical protein